MYYLIGAGLLFIISIIVFIQAQKKEKLTNLLNNLLDKDLENYDKIFNFFESININT